jgi:hypothetical protein
MEQGTGKPCPCKRGKRCPILPETLAIVTLAILAAGLDVAA